MNQPTLPKAMKPKQSLLAAGLVLVVAIVATYLMLRSTPVAEPPRTAAAGPRPVTPAATELSTEPAPTAEPASLPAAPPMFRADAKLARAALAFVGLTPEADQYWIASINDLSLTSKERRELIEDLNNTGLPPNPTVEHLPLIVSRIQLIDQLAPAAIDQVNAAAFAEARKDLVNFYTGLIQPVAP